MIEFKDTKDGIESEYLEEIIPYFGNYALFWKIFIGMRKEMFEKHNVPRPYGLLFPEKFNLNDKENLIKVYKDINRIVYSLFCSLACSHRQIRFYLNAKYDDMGNITIRYDSFNCFYLNLGICRDMLANLIKIILVDLCNEKIKKDKDGNYIPFFKIWLKKEMPSLSEKFNNWTKKISAIRARISHWGSIGKILDRISDSKIAEEYFPLEIKRDSHWYEDHKEVNEGKRIRGDFMLIKDLQDSHEILDGLFEIFIIKYKKFLEDNKINIDYEGKIPYEEYYKYYM